MNAKELVFEMRKTWTIEDFKRVYLKFFNSLIVLDVEFQNKFPEEYKQFVKDENLE